MSDYLDEEQSNEKSARPAFLVVLCVLSYICLGYTVLAAIFQLIRGKQTAAEMALQNVQMNDLIEKLESANMDWYVDILQKTILMSKELNENFYAAFFVTILTLAIGLFGVIKMRKGYKLGFHMYIIYSLLGSAHVYLFVPVEIVPSIIIYFNVIFSGIFIFMYSRNLKWMK
jgi:membrane-associated HD superfamily phosphohydrolase